MTIPWHSRLESARELAVRDERPMVIALTAPG